MSILLFEQVTKDFGFVCAVYDVSLSIEGGRAGESADEGEPPGSSRRHTSR